MSHFPSDAVIVRFGLITPFWYLSMSYGIFSCPSIRKVFHSPDQYLAYNMLARSEDRARIMSTPNGYIAYTNLQDILAKSYSMPGSPVIVDDWEDKREQVMRDAIEMKFSQSAILADFLLRTGTRPIYDDSRLDERFWCHAGGRGLDVHGKILMDVRSRLASGDLLPYVSPSSK